MGTSREVREVGVHSSKVAAVRVRWMTGECVEGIGEALVVVLAPIRPE